MSIVARMKDNTISVAGHLFNESELNIEKAPMGKRLVEMGEIEKVYSRHHRRYFYAPRNDHQSFEKLSEARARYVKVHNEDSVAVYLGALERYQEAVDDPTKVAVSKERQEDGRMSIVLRFSREEVVRVNARLFRKNVFDREQEYFRGLDPVDYPAPAHIYE